MIKGENMSNESMLIVGILGCTFLLMNAIFLGILFFTRRNDEDDHGQDTDL